MITIDLNFKIEKTKDNYDIVKINKDDKWIYIGSKYNMESEIDKFLERIGKDDNRNRIFLIYGFAAGEHIKALRNRFQYNKILVFEPNTKLKKYIDTIDWVESDVNLEVLCCKKEEFLNNILKYINEFDLEVTEFTYFSNYNNIYGYELKKFLQEVKDCFVSMRINISTRFSFSERWFETLIRNIPYMVNGTPLDLYKNKYRNKPAIIVSAGPSLEKNIDQLKQLNDEMLIISGGRNLKSLIDKDIKPNFVTAADPDDLCYELLKGYIEDLNIPLIFYEGTNEKIVDNHKGEKLFFSTSAFIQSIAEKNLMSFAAGGSVAHIMTKCAISFGCNPIIFIGQDLAYTNDKKYSSISDNRDLVEKDTYLENESNIWIKDINGEKVRTSLVLNQFRINFEQIIEQFPDIEFINATEGGARIRGAIEMPLCEVLKKYRGEKIEPISKIENKVNMRKNAIDALNEAKESAEFIIEKCKVTLRYLDELKISYIMKNNNRVNSILKKIDKIDEQINEQYEHILLLESLIYPIIYKTLVGKSTNSDNPNFDEMKIIVGQNKNLYKEILEKLKFSIKYIDEALLKLQEDE